MADPAGRRASDADALAAREYRRALGLFASGVAVIAAEFGGSVHGMTASSVTSLSLEPRLVLLCANRQSKLAAGLRAPATWGVAPGQGAPRGLGVAPGPDVPPGTGAMRGFSINFLRADQEALATYFAGAWREPLAPPFRLVPGSFAPRLEGSLASLDCELHEVLEGGDHWIVIGRVRGLHRGVEPHRPLLFFKGQYRQVDASEGTPAPDLTAVQDEPAQIHYDGGP